MAASSYFRERLSTVPSASASRVYLRGISVVELANLVKYIYTGKLLVAKETMDVTLELSEILELNGVLKGYSDIIELERRKTFDGKADGSELDHFSERFNRSEDVHLATSNDGHSTTHKSVILSTLSNEIKETYYNEVGSTVTYTIEQPVGMDTQTHNTATVDSIIEVSPLDKQYMELSAGNKQYIDLPGGTVIQELETSAVQSNKLQNVVTEDIVIDEQAQHQDLLSVAIEKLSDGSHGFESETNSASLPGFQQLQKSPIEKPDKYVNGKIDTKIVTLSAGKVSNELGGHTSVYTVALDPSTIKQPLKMPRFRRKKTEKERQAEQNAKRYRQKKAELIAGKSQPEFQSDTEKDIQIFRNDYDTLLEVKDCLTHLGIQAVEKDSNVADSIVHDQYSPNFQAVISIPIIEEMPVSDQDGNVLHIQQVQTVLESGEETVAYSDTMGKKDLSEHKSGLENVNSEDSVSKKEDFSCEVDFDGDEDLIQTVTENDHVTNGELGNCDGPKVTQVSEPTNTHVVSSIDTESSKPDSGDSLTSKSKFDQSKTDTDEILCGTDEDSLEPQDEKSDSLVSVTTRSSVSKRKGKVPRHLSNMLCQKAGSRPELCRRSVPLVKTRRSSRNEGSKITGRPAVGASSAGKVKAGKSDTDESQELEEDGYTLMDDDKEFHEEAEKGNVNYVQNPQRMEPKLPRKTQGNIPTEDREILEENREAIQRDVERQSEAECDEEASRILNENLNNSSNLVLETKGIKRKRNDKSDSSTELSVKNVKTVYTENCSELSDSSKELSVHFKQRQEESTSSSKSRLTRKSFKRKSEIAESRKDNRTISFPNVVRDQTTYVDSYADVTNVCPEDVSIQFHCVMLTLYHTIPTVNDPDKKAL